MEKVGVIGAGSWGCALALNLLSNGHEVTMWTHRASQAQSMIDTHRNDKLPEAVLPDNLVITADLKEAVTGKTMIVLAVPSVATRSTLNMMKAYVSADQMICCVSKGIEEETLMGQCDIIADVLGQNQRMGVLSGPSHAEEVVKCLPTVVVAAAVSEEWATQIQNAFMNEVFRVYTSRDVVGTEIGASLKNVIAIAAGISDGLGYGDNSKAALITRGIKEISELAIAMGGQVETLNGLAGIGDLIVTCSSVHSRNRKAGMLIGQGMSMKDAMDQVHMVVEGVYSAKAAYALGKKYGVTLPIIEKVNQILFEGLDPRVAVTELMLREKKPETGSF
ncbi:MAG: NAD(P)-dependent glycerol-3-phosphate dehydrogenase [Lachnospiraceae bacterium]|nr:NAD(P)-dependent glycerol-3-phosphate dehydrogenase [Lachnospiraceae bacterium]